MSHGGTGVVEVDDRTAFVPVSVAGGPTVQVCVDPAAADPVASWFLVHGHDRIDEPVQRAFVGAVRPGDRVLDLGSHLGLFSLTAAAIGASVLSVDANDEHVRLLSSAADRNGFDSLHVAHAAVTEPGGPTHVSFVPRSIHGHVLADGVTDAAAVEVAAETVDDLLDRLGWDGLDVVKMDIEGSEIAALRGMDRLFARGSRPVIVIESNASMLGLQGSSVPALRTLLVELGYELHLIDHLRPGVLVAAGPDDVQPESASDLIATVPGDRARLGDWLVEGPFHLSRLVARILDAAASPAAGYRRHSAELLRDGPAWLRDHPLSRPGREALALDESAEVRTGRAAAARSAGHDLDDAPAPATGRPEEPVLVWAEELSVRRRGRGLGRREMERPPDLAVPEHELALRGASFHLNRHESMAVVADDPAAGAALLAALDGEDVVTAGTLLVRGSTASLRRAADGLEPSLPVADNVLLLGAFLGGHVPAVEEHRDEVLRACGLADAGPVPVQELAALDVAALALAVALVSARPELLLIGALPAVLDPERRTWLTGRAARLQASGTAVVQVVTDPAGLIIEPARALWLHGSHLRAAGHAGSVLDAVRLERLGVRRDGHGWADLQD